jgi:hypothetical protein
LAQTVSAPTGMGQVDARKPVDDIVNNPLSVASVDQCSKLLRRINCDDLGVRRSLRSRSKLWNRPISFSCNSYLIASEFWW